jgi:hypothetical protein
LYATLTDITADRFPSYLDIPVEKEHDEAASSVEVEGRREPVCGDIRERRIQV